ncbi:general transcription factor IIF subunit 1-like isoform X2 [Aethina tumida]|uniref:general transcription factor IIF subunit 1-like isoform X2 n=1 Tax=Aethina tumida TaxID=116153 RepID=UPI002147CC84|nr:general transcription factor IIF subunit 1-like isoform X2 [Aethina tumida]
MSSSSMTSTSSGSQSKPATVQEFGIRVPKNVAKRYHVMRFNGTLDVDFEKWTQVKMERENNMKEYKGVDEDQPKFGAGSEFGREAKEEARRKKLGIVARKYRADDQPWILKSYGSTVKKFKGIREGGVSENTAYYVFTHAEDGAIEAFPLHEWYKFQPIQRYKALSAEEAEEEFNKRNKHLNYFSLMLRKRLKGDEDTELEEGEEKAKKGSSKKDKELKISEMDEWMESSENDSEDEEKNEEDDEENDKKKKKNKKVDPKKGKKKRDTDVEAFEESDDGDGEGRELDYISDSSESEPENTNLESVAEEKALRKLLTSDEDSENDSEKSDKEQSNDDEENKEKEGEKKEDKPDGDKKKKNKKKVKKEEKKELKKDDDDPFSSDSSTDEDVKKKKTDKKGKKEEKETGSANNSRAATPTDNKRKLINDTLAGPSVKKPKLELANYIPGSIESGITEDAVRKYLMRKPMTTTELLQKFKSKKTGLSSEQLVNIMTQILKKINPVKQTLKGKMYLSIKA